VTRPPQQRRAQAGSALILALFALTIVTALAVAFCAVARTDALLAGNRRASLQAFYAARSALNYGRTLLATDDPNLDWAGEDWAAGPLEPEGVEIPGFALEVALGDESARLNLNTATREMLLALPGMTEEAADGILDWRDPDAEPREWGAEADYYLGLAVPYVPSDGPFETPDEVRLVRGVDSALLAGDGTAESPGLDALLTVRSGELNRDSEGRPRLNLNAAGADELAERLGDVLSSDQLAALSARAEQDPFASLAEVVSVQGVPWRAMAQVLDRICVGERDVVEGTVNLNTAGAEVLEAIGLEPEIAQAAIERRSTEPFLTKGELADLPGMTQETMRAVADRVATKSAIFRITVRAQAEGRASASSMFALVDRSRPPGAVILWREQFGPDARPATSEE